MVDAFPVVLLLRDVIELPSPVELPVFDAFSLLELAYSFVTAAFSSTVELSSSLDSSLGACFFFGKVTT